MRARMSCLAPCSILSALTELIPDFRQRGAPLAADIPRTCLFPDGAGQSAVSDYSASAAQSRQLHHFVECVRSLVGRSSRGGRHRHIYGFAGQDLLIEGDAVVGVRTGDRGSTSAGSASRRLNRGSTSARR